MTSANERPAPDTSDREHYPLCYSLDPPIPGNALCNCGVSSRSEALKQAAEYLRQHMDDTEAPIWRDLFDNVEKGEF